MCIKSVTCYGWVAGWGGGSQTATASGKTKRENEVWGPCANLVEFWPLFLKLLQPFSFQYCTLNIVSNQGGGSRGRGQVQEGE